MSAQGGGAWTPMHLIYRAMHAYALAAHAWNATHDAVLRSLAHIQLVSAADEVLSHGLRAQLCHLCAICGGDGVQCVFGAGRTVVVVITEVPFCFMAL
jgi:hypothetical protein